MTNIDIFDEKCARNILFKNEPYAETANRKLGFLARRDFSAQKKKPEISVNIFQNSQSFGYRLRNRVLQISRRNQPEWSPTISAIFEESSSPKATQLNSKEAYLRDLNQAIEKSPDQVSGELVGILIRATVSPHVATDAKDGLEHVLGTAITRCPKASDIFINLFSLYINTPPVSTSSSANDGSIIEVNDPSNSVRDIKTRRNALLTFKDFLDQPAFLPIAEALLPAIINSVTFKVDAKEWNERSSELRKTAYQVLSQFGIQHPGSLSRFWEPLFESALHETESLAANYEAWKATWHAATSYKVLGAGPVAFDPVVIIGNRLALMERTSTQDAKSALAIQRTRANAKSFGFPVVNLDQKDSLNNEAIPSKRDARMLEVLTTQPGEQLSTDVEVIVLSGASWEGSAVARSPRGHHLRLETVASSGPGR